MRIMISATTLTYLLSAGAAIAISLFGYLGLQQDSTQADRSPLTGVNITPLERAARAARAGGVDSAYIELLLADSLTSFDAKYVKNNVTNFASKADYSHNFSQEAVSNVREFVKSHDTTLQRAKQRFGVPSDVIAALMWVETKHGRITGKHHVPSVYLSVLLSSEPEYLESNTQIVLKAKELDSTKHDSVYTSIEKRAQRKVTWATSQLKALATIQKNKTMNTLTLRGSWAGAFGYTQFLPSSYLSWATDGGGDREIDLYKFDDAIFSVANYLDRAGWGESDAQQRKAVHHYNNSDDYVNAVLKLAKLSAE
jgi:membrane-bound lytic murein transglycosylase B